MAWYPQSATGLNYITYPAGDATTTVSASGSTNTKGSYAQLTASSSFTCNALIANMVASNTASSPRFLWDIATGAGGAEVDVLPNLLCGGRGSVNDGRDVAWATWFPVGIAASTRIATRCQSTVSSAQMFVAVQLIAAGGVSGVSSLVNYGASTGSSTGVTIDPGGAASTYGSYAQLSASTSAVIQWLAVLTAADTVGTTAVAWVLELSTGAGGAEVVLMPDLHVDTGGNSAQQPQIGTLTYIAASTRVAMRAASSNTTSGQRQIAAELLVTVAPSEPAASSGGSYGFA